MSAQNIDGTKNVVITYNPYKPETLITVDGLEISPASALFNYRDRFLQEWVAEIPDVLRRELGTFRLSFRGAPEDYDDLKISCSDAEKRLGIHIFMTWAEGRHRTEKEQLLREIFARAYPMLHSSAEVERAFNDAFSDNLEVNVVAAMSAGKSMLINALLGTRLMPSQNNACTAKIVSIRDVDGAVGWKADVFDKSCQHNLVRRIDNLNLATMKALNDEESIGEIHITGDILFVGSDIASLMLVDTPGVDNALNTDHRRVTEAALDASSKVLVVFVMDASHIHSDSEDELLHRIAESMRLGGRLSRERFFFIINKLDVYRSGEDSIDDTIAMTKRYLCKHGIENPRIFPVSALAALTGKMCAGGDLPEDEKSDAERLAKKLIRNEQLHLERYSDIPVTSRALIDSELSAAVAANDIYSQMLVHSGIRNVEEMMKIYVTKYSRPQKIANAVRLMRGTLYQAREMLQNGITDAATADGLIKALDDVMEI